MVLVEELLYAFQVLDLGDGVAFTGLAGLTVLLVGCCGSGSWRSVYAAEDVY